MAFKNVICPFVEKKKTTRNAAAEGFVQRKCENETVVW